MSFKRSSVWIRRYIYTADGPTANTFKKKVFIKIYVIYQKQDKPFLAI